MPDGFLILLLALELEDDDLVPAAVGHDGGLNLPAGGQFAAFFERSFYGQFDFRAHLAGQLFHADEIARGNPVLFSASFNDRVHLNLDWMPEHTECVTTARSKKPVYYR